MKALLQLTIWAWLTLIIVPLACPSVIEETKEPPRYEKVTFNFEAADCTSYLKSVETDLRDKVRSKVVHGIPVTAKTVPISELFVLVDLIFEREKFITLAINVTNRYLVGYCDKDDKGKDRANFLKNANKDADKVAKDNLFKEAQVVITTEFTCDYLGLERYAETGRKNIELGVYKLDQAIRSVYGKSEEKKKAETKIEAKFFIISIQMVSEAARFQYILNKVLQGGIYGSYKPDYKAISLEASWDKISKAIQTADASGKFSSPIILKDEHDKTWTIKKVSDIKKDMGLLKFLKTPAGQASQFSQLMQMADI
ncbi:unnamed protein product [Dovyalis caffra]|uniref:rRNA N-glycosylase n=1 Tax=Dovyalis caffra TaxID=77055 RepID=A0AAV1SIN1_9ROSI|nr:unnamed protein product [Dovyalis caffra]CAK7352005.1 unnamed protein product [Dovyalis caffra]